MWWPPADGEWTDTGEDTGAAPNQDPGPKARRAETAAATAAVTDGWVAVDGCDDVGLEMAMDVWDRTDVAAAGATAPLLPGKGSDGTLARRRWAACAAVLAEAGPALEAVWVDGGGILPNPDAEDAAAAAGAPRRAVTGAECAVDEACEATDAARLATRSGTRFLNKDADTAAAVGATPRTDADEPPPLPRAERLTDGEMGVDVVVRGETTVETEVEGVNLAATG